MKKLLALLFAGIMIFGLAACGGSSDAPAPAETDAAAPAETGAEAPAETEAAGSDLDAIIGRGVLVVGITDFEPMDYTDENGEWIGFDADMARAFAEELGVDIEFVEIDWDNKILELNSGAVDCIWNGMTLSDEVMCAMECTAPYMSNSQAIVASADAAAAITSIEDCAELSFAVEAGSAGEAAAEDAGLTYTPVQNQAAALMEVQAGTSDAAIIDELMAIAMVGEGTSYADLAQSINLTEEEYGVGFRQGSDAAAALNDFFAASYADGSMTQIAETYGLENSIIPQ
ncbi:MAG: transporter substrate-binding domain-containing protein [Lachnospiraceae bacterium]|nr:transporter substrate-binding domain-containing protein [Lachnospiraceae bacterium]